MYGIYCLVIFFTTIISLYGSLSEILEHGLSYKELGLFVLSGYCMGLLFLICNEAYHASRKVLVTWYIYILEINKYKIWNLGRIRVSSAPVKCQLVRNGLQRPKRSGNVFDCNRQKPAYYESESVREYKQGTDNCCKDVEFVSFESSSYATSMIYTNVFPEHLLLGNLLGRVDAIQIDASSTSSQKQS